VSESDRAGTQGLIGRLLLASAGFIALMGAAFWSGVFPLDDRVRPLLASGAAVAATADALLGAFFLWKSAQR
jgi:hypothetical protein